MSGTLTREEHVAYKLGRKLKLEDLAFHRWMKRDFSDGLFSAGSENAMRIISTIMVHARVHGFHKKLSITVQESHPGSGWIKVFDKGKLAHQTLVKLKPTQTLRIEAEGELAKEHLRHLVWGLRSKD